MEQNVVCSDCGIVASNVHDARVVDRESDRQHDWSAADPLSRVEARIESSVVEAEVGKHYNEDWWVLVVELTDHDHVAASEVVGDAVRAEGFRFIGIDENPKQLRFNKERP